MNFRFTLRLGAVIAGTLVLFRFLKRRREMIQEQPLTADERKRAEEILRSA